VALSVVRWRSAASVQHESNNPLALVAVNVRLDLDSSNKHVSGLEDVEISIPQSEVTLVFATDSDQYHQWDC